MMGNTNKTSSSHKIDDSHAHYKVTRTVTGADGKTRTETMEMVDDDAMKAMQDFRLRHDKPFNTNRSAPQSSRGAKRATTTQDNSEFVQEALEVHNALRRKHGVEPLRINNDLSKLAQQWANHLASTDSLVHSKTKYRDGQVGENLRSQSWSITGREMTEAWYDECKRYDYYDRQSYQSGTGHFTQLVWKNTQEVGFARAQGPSMNYAVAMYYPAGNFLGEFPKNVYPPV